MIRLFLIVSKPIHILLAVTVVIGLFLFKDYGLTWDEPLFYKYGDALGYAYTPANWFSSQFDLNNSYGPSGDDHKTRGPGYLLLARGPVYLLENLHLDTASAWHLVNFLTYLLGVYFVYRICARLMSPWPALTASGLFAFQPLLWGHAFINPKDMPFLVFLTGAVWLGFRMVDQLTDSLHETRTRTFGHILFPAFFLGIATANRVLGPLAGLLVLAYFFAQRPRRKPVFWIVMYSLLSALVTFAAWPYLWVTSGRFLDVFRLMSANPTVLPVLFADQVFRAYDLPRRYLPFFLFFTLTELVWPLFILGLTVAIRRLLQDRRRLIQLLLLVAWFMIPLAYVVLLRPPLYDGMRHFLFILPPVFVFAGFAIEFLITRIRNRIVNILIMAAILSPGLVGIVRLHPYEYTYYNSFIGGTAGAFRHYETDYWLTCYKDAVQTFNQMEPQPVKLYVHREAQVAQPYAAGNIIVLDERGAKSQIRSGDFVLVNTRTNEDRQVFHDAPLLLSIGRAGAIFCVIKGIP